MQTYINWVTQNPLLSAAIQFAILGTLGEIVAFSFIQKKFALPCQGWQIFAKMAAWAVSGVVIKYGFSGMKGFTNALLEHQLLPAFFKRRGW